MERLKRYNKQIIAVMSAFVVLVGGVLSTSFHSLAVNYEYYVGYSQPTCNENSGYFSVVSSHNDGSLYTYFWTFTGLSDSNGSAEMAINVTSSTTVVFTPVIYPISSSAWCTMGYFDNTGMLHMTRYGLVAGNTNSITETFTYGIAGFVFGGNVTGFSNGYRDVPTPIIHWNESADGVELNNKLNEVLTRLANLDVDTDVMINTLTSIYNMDVDIATKIEHLTYYMNDWLAKIKAEQEKSNTWLEKIWNSIQEFINPSEEEETDSEQFESETTEKSDEIGGLVEESKTEKPDVDDMNDSIDSNLDMTSANEYGAVLLNITENEYILQMLLIVVTVAIIAYVLFGKR